MCSINSCAAGVIVSGYEAGGSAAEGRLQDRRAGTAHLTRLQLFTVTWGPNAEHATHLSVCGAVVLCKASQTYVSVAVIAPLTCCYLIDSVLQDDLAGQLSKCEAQIQKLEQDRVRLQMQMVRLQNGTGSS